MDNNKTNENESPQIYKSSSWLKIILSSCATMIPIAEPLVTYYDEYVHHKEMNSIITFLNYLQERIKQLEKNVITEDNWRLLELAVKKIRLESREWKIRSFANLLSSCWTTRQDSFEKKYRFLEAIDKLDELHLNILRFLESKNELISTSRIKEELKISNTHTELLPALFLLASEYGFIYRTWGTTSKVLMTKNLSPEAIAYKCKCKITKTGTEFLAYIKNYESLCPDE